MNHGGSGTASRSPFEVFGGDDLTALIAEYPLAWIVPPGAGAGLPSLLPLLAETDDGGRLTALIGHMARRNPLLPVLSADPSALLLFTGPQAYVSPALVSDPTWAPTWNFAQARIEARIAFEPGGGAAAIERMLAAMEAQAPTGWTTADMGPRYAPMEAAIIAFRAEVVDVAARFKLGQDEKPARLREIVAGHPDAALVRWMKRFNPGRY